jgi:hypothetical protein
VPHAHHEKINEEPAGDVGCRRLNGLIRLAGMRGLRRIRRFRRAGSFAGKTLEILPVFLAMM